MKLIREMDKTHAILTIGHSTRKLEDFIELLKTNGVDQVVDIRTIPRSRFNPQFNKDTLPLALKSAGIGYEHLPGLGGLRHPQPDSANTGWRNASFRGFADYMATDEFEENLQVLSGQAKSKTICLMCAESVPWRCHRSLVADALLTKGIRVEHIINETPAGDLTNSPPGRKYVMVISPTHCLWIDRIRRSRWQKNGLIFPCRYVTPWCTGRPTRR